MNKISYLKKIIILLKFKFLYKNNFLYPNFYLFNTSESEIKKSKKILFYFNNPEFMHLGDHLFFIPCIVSMINSGLDVIVCPSESMLALFQRINIPTVKSKPIFSDFDVIISRIEFLLQLKNQKSVLINITKNLTLPIADFLTISLRRLFLNKNDISNFIFDMNFKKIDLAHFGLNQNKKYIIFNPYVDSGGHMITSKKIKKLISFVTMLAKKSNLEIAIFGSTKDFAWDKKNYPFNYIDLRGKTNILDVFSLVKMDNIMCFVGFDSFTMHVFSLLQKKSYVVFRGRIRKEKSMMIQKYHVPLFCQDNFVELI